MMSVLRSLLLLAITASAVDAFSPPSVWPQHDWLVTSSSASPSRNFNSALEAFRRDVFAAGCLAIAAGLPRMALADVDDLAMPTGNEQKSADEAAMQERIRRKRELQKKASSPINFTDNFAREQEKQKDMKKQSQQERRNAMCEELGRGC